MPREITLYCDPDSKEFYAYGWDDDPRYPDEHIFQSILDGDVAAFDAWWRARGDWPEGDMEEHTISDALDAELQEKWYFPELQYDGSSMTPLDAEAPPPLGPPEPVSAEVIPFPKGGV